MTRKHFKALADELRQTKPPIADNFRESLLQWKEDVLAVAFACQRFNAHFDPEKFKRACKYYDTDSD